MTEIEDLKPIEQANQLDVSQYEGSRVEIEKTEVVDMTTNYDDNGNWVEGLARPCKMLKVTTKALTKLDLGNGTIKDITASELFNLKQNKKTMVWGWSENEKGKLFRFFKKLKVNSPKELVGKLVTVTLRPDKKDPNKNWLGFVV